MPATLRAFFMLRSSDGEWDIQVFRTLEDILDAWTNFGDEGKSAVLHVGFDRRVAKSFEELALQFPGMVLLTPGAKGALPDLFAASSREIGRVSDEPVFLALQGWGYASPEPTQILSAKLEECSDWVRTFLNEYTQHTDLLIEVGIVDDKSYLELEATLDRDLRLQTGLYRFKFLVGDDCSDPCAIARAAPPWLASRELANLDLTVRIRNVFQRLPFKIVKDIGSLTEAELLAFQNFGRTSIVQLNDIFQRALLAGPRDLNIAGARSSTESLLDVVNNSLLSLSDRSRDILVRRMGLGKEVESQENIGDSYGLKRQRIQQIEAKAVDCLVRREIWDDVLAEKLKLILADREFPLPLIGAEAIDPWFSGVAAHRNAFQYLIKNMCNAPVHLVEIDCIEYLSFLSPDTWREMVATSRQLLASGVEKRWTETDCKNYVKLLVPDDAGEFGSLLWEVSSRWCHFALASGESTLISYGQGVDQVIEAVLEESAAPMHYSEIAEHAAKRLGRNLDERRVHSAAAEVGYLFGSGIYGMLRHMLVTRDVWESLAEEASQIVMEGPANRQWHSSELVFHLAERGVDVPNEFDKYQLDIALKKMGQISSLGRMVWTSGDASTESARLDIHQALIAILQNAGGPLSTAELRQRVVALRGINEGMEFQVKEPLIKLNSQLWALNDRDLSIKRHDQPAFLQLIVNKLNETKKPVHITHCANLFGNVVPARALFCLAPSDTRLKVTQDRYLTLKEWQHD